MKKILSYFMILGSLAMVVACQDDANISSTHKTELGVVLPAGTNSSQNVILFRDGRLARPQNGFKNFDGIAANSKFQLKYDVVSVTDGLSFINVLSHQSANDSIFIPTKTYADGFHFTNTTYSGTFQDFDPDSALVNTGEATFRFADNKVEITLSQDGKETISSSGAYTSDSKSIVFPDSMRAGDSPVTYGYLHYNSNLWMSRAKADGGVRTFSLQKQ